MRTENNIQHEILMALCKGASRVFRNNVGMINGVRFGLKKGSADLIGWRTVEITEDMVGTKIAQFLSVEVKTPTGRASKEQKVWERVVNEAGGCAFIARSAEEAIKKAQG